MGRGCGGENDLIEWIHLIRVEQGNTGTVTSATRDPGNDNSNNLISTQGHFFRKLNNGILCF